MLDNPDFQTRPAFEVLGSGSGKSPFVFNSPHSGRYYSERFLKMSRLDERAIRRSEDFFVDQLYSGVASMGAPMLVAHFPRAYLDVNREPYELDGRMFSEALPSYANRNSVRVAGGLGTVPRVVAEGHNIYSSRLPLAEAQMRIETVYKTYHSTLRGLLADAHRSEGHAVLVDCHSMPSSIRLGGDGVRPDFVIGDRFGTSANAVLTETIVSTLRSLGYLVVTNKPYAGGFITQHYGRPAKGLHAVQIEINRALYFDEQRLEKKPGFDSLREDLTHLAAVLMALPDAEFMDYSIAAE